MGNTQSLKKISYEDMQIIIKKPESYLVINTLPQSEQQCLILNTLPASNEEMVINKYLKENKNIRIVIYGKNNNDETVYKKSQQLISLGFLNLFMYTGGIFEWLLLQDIFGTDLFPTTNSELDMLKYKPTSILNTRLLEY
jgi:hypothetical protein